MCLRQVDEVEGVQHGSQVKGKVGSMQDGTVITVQGHGIDVSPVWRHSGMGLSRPTVCSLAWRSASRTACFTWWSFMCVCVKCQVVLESI